jgi:DNA-binding transcriptional ArsR family regulator
MGSRADRHTHRPATRELPTPAARARVLALFQALAHEGRLAVLFALSRRGPMNVSALQDLTGLEQSALSHQLRVLREAGLVEAERDGKSMVYALDDTHVAHVIEDALAHSTEAKRGGAR